MKSFKQHIGAMNKRFDIDVKNTDDVNTCIYTFAEDSDYGRAFNIARTTKGVLAGPLDEQSFVVTALKEHQKSVIQRIRSIGVEGSVIDFERYNPNDTVSEAHRARGNRKLWMNASTRKKASTALRMAIGDTYYKEIPISNIIKYLKKVDVIVIDEEGGEWSGFLMGRDSSALFQLAGKGTGKPAPWNAKMTIYEPFINAALALQWYKQDKRSDKKYEINGYIT